MDEKIKLHNQQTEEVWNGYFDTRYNGLQDKSITRDRLFLEIDYLCG